MLAELARCARLHVFLEIGDQLGSTSGLVEPRSDSIICGPCPEKRHSRRNWRGPYNGSVVVSAKLVNDVLAATTELLKPLRIQKRPGHVYTRDLKNFLTGFIGMNYGLSEIPTINPVVGVRHEKIETVVADLRGKTDQQRKENRWAPTVGAPIGYLMPGKSFLAGAVKLSGNIQQEAQVLFSRVKDYAVPFWDAHSSTEAIVHALEERTIIDPGVRMYALPVGYFLLGDVKSGIAAIANMPKDKVPADYSEFARAFRKKVGES